MRLNVYNLCPYYHMAQPIIVVFESSMTSLPTFFRHENLIRRCIKAAAINFA